MGLPQNKPIPTGIRVEISSGTSSTGPTENKWFNTSVKLAFCLHYPTASDRLKAQASYPTKSQAQIKTSMGDYVKPQLRQNSGMSEGHAKVFQQVNERVARMRYDILLVEKFSALLLSPRKGHNFTAGPAANALNK